LNLVIGLLVPFLGTSLGAACVFFMKNGLNRLVQKALLGFASGVMVAASVWSLLIPSINMSETMGRFAFLPAAVGFVFGILFLLLMDKIIPHLHMNEEKPEGLPSHLKKTTMLVLAVTLHNIPEGMAVGVVFAGLLSGNSTITLAGAFSLSIGIAIQNFPEGAIISLPLKSEGGSTKKAFWYGVASGVVEPIAAGITIILAVREAVDKFICTGKMACVATFFISRIFIAPAEVFIDGSGEKHVVLQYYGDLIAQGVKIVGTYIFSADENSTFRNVIKTADQVDE
jgi:zinc transporter, ZIP family